MAQVKDVKAALACANLRPENWRTYLELNPGALVYLIRLVPCVAQEATRFLFWLVTIAFMPKSAAKAHAQYVVGKEPRRALCAYSAGGSLYFLTFCFEAPRTESGVLTVLSCSEIQNGKGAERAAAGNGNGDSVTDTQRTSLLEPVCITKQRNSGETPGVHDPWSARVCNRYQGYGADDREWYNRQLSLCRRWILSGLSSRISSPSW